MNSMKLDDYIVDMSLLARQLAKAISNEFPILKRAGNIQVTEDVVLVQGFAATECEAFCRDVDDIVYNQFEGKIKEVEWCVVEEFGYVTARPIADTARTA